MGLFNTVPKPKIKKTAFNLSHERKQSQGLGTITPVLMEEVVPGDKWNIRTETLIKLAPLIAPIMHRVEAYLHYFFVPNRIVWSDWEDFITGETVTTVPTKSMTSTTFYAAGSLANYLGIPYNSANLGLEVSQLPFRAYWKIWNEYYRDQNLQTEKSMTGLVSADYYNLPYRAWKKDYFTSALPWAQKGASVTMEGTEVTYKHTSDYYRTDGSPIAANTPNMAPATSPVGNLIDNSAAIPGTTRVENIESFGIDINEFRTAHRLQRYLERIARSGTRYTEWLLGVFGVHSSDARLNRPEYLGGGRQTVVVSEVLNTSDTANAEQGNPSGHGLAVGGTNGVSKFFNEHGYIIGLLSIVPMPAYRQGLHKKWTRSVNTDFYLPDFANLGEQEVLNRELYAQGTTGGTDDEEIFGYQSRYSEYKFAYDQVAGDFAVPAGSANSLEFWHLGRKFGSLPALNETFITTEAESGELETRVFAAGRTAQPFWVQMYHNIKVVRPMPYYGTPTI